MAPYSDSDMISMDTTTALGTPEPVKPKVHAVNPPTPPLSTCSSSISSTSYRERSDSDNVTTGRSRASPRTPRRSRVQSMPEGSDVAMEFFSTPISSSVPSTPLGVRKTITEPPCVPELEGFNDVAVEEPPVVETKTVKVCHSSKEEQVKISEEKNPNISPPGSNKRDGEVDVRCQQCIIL